MSNIKLLVLSMLLSLCTITTCMNLRNAFQKNPDLRQNILDAIPTGETDLRSRVSGYIDHLLANESSYLEDDCENCKDFIDFTRGLLPVVEDKPLLDIALDICISNSPANQNGKVYCPGVIYGQGRAALDALRRLNDSVSNSRVCQMLNSCFEDRPENILTPLGNPSLNKNKQTNPKPRRSQQKSTFTILQITDLHINLQYAENSSTDCMLPVCCYDFYKGNGSAHKYGDYDCNIPERTFSLFLDEINRLEPQPEFIIYTGDHPPQTGFNETYESQLQSSEALYNLLMRKMPNATIYPVIGNHEMYPTAMYFLELNETNSMVRQFGEWWKGFAKFGPEQLETWNNGGYFTLPTSKPKLRILGFNTNYGYTSNFYNILNIDRPEYRDQLNFMRQVLYNASRDGEKVIMIGHHPPNLPDTIYHWGDHYTQVVRENPDVIAMQIFGHQHSDQFTVVTSADGQRPESLVLISPPIVTHRHVNPSMRIFTLEEETYTLLDFEQHFFNLTAAQGGADPEIVKSYAAKEEYDLPDMSALSWQNLAKRIETDDAAFEKYRRNWKVHVKHNCGRQCRINDVCGMLESSYDKHRECFQSKNATFGSGSTAPVTSTVPVTVAGSSGPINRISATIVATIAMFVVFFM